MKNAQFFAAGLMAFAAAAASAQDIKFAVPGQEGAAAPASAPAAASGPPPSSDQLIEEFGWFIAKRVGIADLEFSPAEIQALTKGVSEAVSGKPAPYDLQRIGPDMDAYMQKKQGAYLAKLKQQNQAESAAFFAKLKADKTIVALPSGLYYKIVKPGDGPGPKPSDTVRVNYTGKLLNDTIFDTSLEPRQPGGVAEPAELRLDQTIPGWTEGMQKIGKGGKIELYIPAELGYGDEPQQRIPPGSTLVFEVELLDIKPAAAGAPAAKP